MVGNLQPREGEAEGNGLSEHYFSTHLHVHTLVYTEHDDLCVRRINPCGHAWYVSDNRELFDLVTLAPFSPVFVRFACFVGSQSL